MTKKLQVQRQAAPIRQQVTTLLKRDILDGFFMPGDRLVESALCERYGVSRTVIREVLRLLESEHLISVVPLQGPIVTKLSEEDIINLYLVRAKVESFMIELFIKNANVADKQELKDLYENLDQKFLNGSVDERWEYKDKFYDILLKGAKNNVLEEMILKIQARVGLFKHFAFVYEDRVKRGYEDLKLIFDATLAEDIEQACAHNDQHLLDAGEAAVINYKRRLNQNSL
ncbi:GntR family transcriptional regulator [Acinetobacter baumannii]|uniref:GntR family transcriptional regulator n=1 Tax=Acinetobacter baumannii TaxID=470 RepID=UPI00135FF37D|nr:GntR family transcriptional regulator [Acinetobacter baumannii]CAA0200510.1 GntR family transcriptional regulator [Acinetobacter baumannii]